MPFAKPRPVRRRIAGLAVLVAALGLTGCGDTGSLDPSVAADIETSVQVQPAPVHTGFGPEPKDRVVYAATSGKSGIWVVHADGTDRTRLTTGSRDRYPMFSPDGRTIVFTRYESRATPDPGVYRMNSDGSGLRRIVPDAVDAEFTPDGRRIIFSQAGEVHLSGLDGRNRERVDIPADGGVRHPTLSPDGRHVAWVEHDEGYVVVLATIGAGEVQPRHLGYADPSFSPDGTQVLATREGPNGGVCVYDVGDVDASRGQTRRCVSGFEGRFAPDGASLIFVRQLKARESRAEIWRSNADGTGARRLIDLAGDLREPAWGVGAPCNPATSTPPGYRVLDGTAQANKLAGAAGSDLIRGRGGNDRIYGGAGNDILCGGGGGDILRGGPGRDRLVGGSGRDKLVGGPGRDDVEQ